MGYFTETTDTPSEEILVSGHGSDLKTSVSVRSGAGVLSRGQVVGQFNTGTNSGLYDKYDDSVSNGLNVAAGILADKVDATSSGVQAAIYSHGKFYEERIIGLDASAKTDLKNCEFVNWNV